MTEEKPNFVLRYPAASEKAANDLGSLLKEWLERNGPDELFRTCNNCSFMTGKQDKEEAAYCNLWKMTPPAHVIINGCPSHKDEYENVNNPCEVPF
jgi:hypothetical protein